MDQGKAQLYSTFAANGGDKGAQMALAYRYWTGIGTSESCERALAWYGSAAEQGMFCHDSLPASTKICTRVHVSYEQIHFWTSWRPYFASDSDASVRLGGRHLWSRS